MKKAAIKGARWGFIENFSSLAITFVVAFVLQRWFLSPKEFGLIGHLSFFIAISISLIDSGFSAAIIRKKEPLKEDLSTTFVLNLSVSLLCFLLLFFTAPYIASYFEEPQLQPLLRVLSIVLILNAVSIIQRVLIIKAIDFKRLTICSVVSAILSGVVGIGMAFMGYGVWSLVGQQITKQLVQSLMLWILGSWKPSFRFSVKSFRELFSYGSNVMFTGLLDTFFKNIYFPVIGKSYGTAILGQYTTSDKYNNITSYNLSQIVQRVSFPVLSKAQDSDQRLKEVFRTILKVAMFASVFISFFLSAVSRAFIVGLIGEKWLMAASILSITCLAGAFYPAQGLYQNLLQIKGKMRCFLAIEILKKVLMAISIVLGIIFKSLQVLLWGMVAASILTLLVNAYFSGKSIGYSPFAQIKDLLPMFLVSFVVALIGGIVCELFIFLCKSKLGWYDITCTNLCAVALSALFCGGLLYIVYRIFPAKEMVEIKNLLRVWKS